MLECRSHNWIGSLNCHNGKISIHLPPPNPIARLSGVGRTILDKMMVNCRTNIKLLTLRHRPKLEEFTYSKSTSAHSGMKSVYPEITYADMMKTWTLHTGKSLSSWDLHAVRRQCLLMHHWATNTYDIVKGNGFIETRTFYTMVTQRSV